MDGSRRCELLKTHLRLEEGENASPPGADRRGKSRGQLLLGGKRQRHPVYGKCCFYRAGGKGDRCEARHDTIRPDPTRHLSGIGLAKVSPTPPHIQLSVTRAPV